MAVRGIRAPPTPAPLRCAEPCPTSRPRATPEELIALIRASVIGDDEAVAGPFGIRRVTYADYTASGRNLTFIEDYIREQVMPLYANTHTESSGTGLPDVAVPGGCPRPHPCRGRRAPRGVRGHLLRLGLHGGRGQAHRHPQPAHPGGPRPALRPALRHIPPDERPVVFIGPFEHHSNELPWRESIADVVTIHEDRGRPHRPGPPGRGAGPPRRPSAAHRLLLGRLQRDRHPLRHAAISILLHEHGALAFWDYGAAAPYVEMDLAGHGPAGPRTTASPGTARPRRQADADALHLGPQAHRRPRHAGPARRAPRAAPELGAHRARRRDRGLRQRRRARLPRRTRSAARRAARPPSSSRSARASSSSSRRRSASRPSAPGRSPSSSAPSQPGRECQGSRSSATCARAGCPSSASSSATASGYPPPRLRGDPPQRPLRHPVARRLLLRRALRPPPAGHRPEPRHTASSGRSCTAARASSPAGCA